MQKTYRWGVCPLFLGRVWTNCDIFSDNLCGFRGSISNLIDSLVGLDQYGRFSQYRILFEVYKIIIVRCLVGKRPGIRSQNFMLANKIV